MKTSEKHMIRAIHKVGITAGALTMSLVILNSSCKMHPEVNDTLTAPSYNYITLSDAQIQMANIKIAEVFERSIGRKLSLTGVLKVNEQSAVNISSRVPGRIEKLFFKNTGETVKKGDKLYEYYSEDLVNAQREYYTLQSNNWNFSGRYEPSLALENKLLIMGMIPAQIKELGKSGKILFRVVIYSPAEGKIRSVNVTEGQYITIGQSMFELAGDNNLWLEAQVYPGEIQYLKTGMAATVFVPGTGELPLKSEISFINPSFETGKNITLVRAVVDNPENKLHPGMFAILNVQTQTRHGIVIPSSAVINNLDGDQVWIRDENGKFLSRIVTTGIHSDDSVMIVSGLAKSEKIVTSGSYLLNSEMILKHGLSSPGTKEQ